eukprot:GAFH01003751.1.p2 GENE.GAFH01003751.1~~GAFH01003751.1.p2  ORF type:complete len:164 (+),score=33.04 GAFH01003751.1:193-684(+)
MPPGQNFPMDVRVDVYNGADVPATDVSIFDFWGPHFEALLNTTKNEEGALVAHFDSIAPKTNASHIFHLKPLSAGTMKPLPVTVQYKQVLPGDSEKDTEFQVAHAEMLTFRPIYILTEVEYRRHMTSHLIERAVFFGFAALAVLIPGLMHYTQKSKPTISKRK